MTLRSRRRRRVDGVAALHADCGRRRAGTPPAPPRHMRLLVGEIMVDRGRARGGQRVLEDGSSKEKALWRCFGGHLVARSGRPPV